MEKMCGALMEAFMEEYPNVTVTTEYTGSGAGIESVTSEQLILVTLQELYLIKKSQQVLRRTS